MKALLLSICIIFLACQSKGQNHNLTGIILDEKYTPLEFVNVTIYNKSDSTLIKVEPTDEKGNFKFISIKSGTYFLKASMVGYDPLLVNPLNLNSDISLGNLIMNNTAIELQETVITGQRRLVEVHPDKMVFNVQGTVNAAGDNGLELLRKAPGVLLDNNNNITVLGRSGVIVYIDGKRLPLGGTDLANYLQNLISDQIDRIDIISNPGTKYDAEGNAGIIDIRLKKDKNLGGNGTVNAAFGQGKKSRMSLGSTGNYRTKKYNAFGSLGFNKFEGFSNINSDNYQNSFFLTENNRIESDFKSVNYKAGLDYFLDTKNTIGFMIDGNHGNGTVESTNTALISNISTQSLVDSNLVASNLTPRDNDNNTINLNYQFRENEKTINIDFDYGRYRTNADSYQPNTYYAGNENVIKLKESAYQTITPVKIDIFTFKIDLENPFLTGVLGYGAKASRVNSDNTFLFSNYINGSPVQNDDRSNRFKYNESVYAGYVNYAQNLGQLWKINGGIRVEKTDAVGDLIAFKPEKQEPKVIQKYWSYFPSLGISYSPKPDHSINANVGRRINRPDYNVLNPFTSQLSELSYEKGNAFLKPEFVNNAEIGYTFLYRYNIKLSYSKTTNQITRLIAADDDNPKAGFISWDNLSSQTVWNMNAALPFDIKKWWSLFVNLSASRLDNQAKYENGSTIDLQAFSYNLFMQNSFVLGGGYKGEVSGWYSGPGIWGGVFEYDPSYSLNFGIQKKFFDKLNVRLNFQDVTYQSGWSGKTNFGGLQSYGHGNWDSRRGTVSISYDFGNKNVKSRRRSTGMEDESKRIGGGEGQQPGG